MKCSQCTFESPPGMKFCGQCGAKLGLACPQCGTESPPGFKFCGECGGALTAAGPPPPPPPQTPAPAAQSYTPAHLAEQVLQSRAALEGERKQVTVLFCDLVGSTGLADLLGPEVMHLLLNRFFELALSEVHRYEGTINQFLGDGFMALFGAPITHEDHARRAVLAACGLQKLLREHQEELVAPGPVEVAVRMGINTGWVVVGGIGDHLRMDYTAVGDTTNLAARLQQNAGPGEILLSEATSRFLHGAVQLADLGPLQVKGKAEPIHAFRLIGLGSRQSEQAVLSAAASSPFIGRVREMAILDQLRERASGGEGQVAGIAGEAGVGKSRFLYELRRRLWPEAGAYLSARCLSYGGGIPYLPLLYLLRNEWGIGEADTPAAIADKVRPPLTHAGLEVEDALPYLLRLLGVREGTERLDELSPQAFQTRAFAILRHAIIHAGQGRLVVLEIEDLHWIDESSEDFLSFLVEGLPTVRLLLLLTYRSGYRPRWIDRSYATQIALSRLTDRESQMVMEGVLRRAKLPENLMSTVLSKADGNPFFLEELTRSLLEQPDTSVPDTVQGVVMARIDRLPEDHKRLLQTASVLGREFSMSLLAAVWEAPEALPALVADLKRWEFLYEEPTVEEPLYFFKHALTQEAVLQTLLTSRRQALHAAAGHAFETVHAGHLEDVCDNLAYHYSAAGDAEKAVRYLALSADKAARGYAHAEAAKALGEALKHAQRLPAAQRDGRTVELMLQLAHSQLPLARFAETLELFLGSAALVERLADPALSGRYFFWLAHTYSYLGNQEEAARNAHLAIAAARQAGDVATEGKARYVISRDAFWSGQFSAGIEHGLQAVALLERGDERWWQGQAYWVVGFHHYVLGKLPEALADMGRTHALWQALEDPRLDPSWSTGYFYAATGDWELGIQECRGGLERSRDPLNTAAALGFLGYAYLEKGDLRRAIEALEDSVQRLRQAGMQQLLGWFSAFLAEAYARSERASEARELAEQAYAVITEVNFRYGAGLARRSQGRIALWQGDHTGSASFLEEALAIFRALQAPFEEGRTLLDLARLGHARGDTAEAARRLGEARRLFAGLQVPHYREHTETLAGELAIPFVPPA